MTCLSDVLTALPGLADHELEAVIEAATGILKQRITPGGAEEDGPARGLMLANGGGTGRKTSPRGWLEIKIIKGHPYVYRRWRDGKTMRSQYVGRLRDVYPSGQ